MIPKFRAWDKNTNDMVDVKTIDLEKDGSIGCIVDYNGINLDMSECILMQSTGLKDTNGIESWEGNYLTKEGCWPFFIEWIENEGCLMAVPVNSVQKTNWKPVAVKELLDKGYVNNSNIYENPELLEGTE
ncbi:YopX family protein [Enterococcus faecalis]|uniref:YopX family protein n=1 Tax=Enterococcus faecalis TaxID=1351 RepID=UPI0034D36200